MMQVLIFVNFTILAIIIFFKIALPRASARGFQEDLKVMLVNGYGASGFKFPCLLYTDLLCCKGCDTCALVKTFEDAHEMGSKIVIEVDVTDGQSQPTFELPREAFEPALLFPPMPDSWSSRRSWWTLDFPPVPPSNAVDFETECEPSMGGWVSIHWR